MKNIGNLKVWKNVRVTYTVGFDVEIIMEVERCLLQLVEGGQYTVRVGAEKVIRP